MKKNTLFLEYKIQQWLKPIFLLLKIFALFFPFLKRKKEMLNERGKSFLAWRFMFAISLAIFTFTQSSAQFTIDTTGAPGNFSNNNGSGLTTFNFVNNNAFDIMITDVSASVSG